MLDARADHQNNPADQGDDLSGKLLRHYGVIQLNRVGCLPFKCFIDVMVTCEESTVSKGLLRAVVRAQNNLTQQVLATCDTRGKFKTLMTEMFDFPKNSCPFQRGEPGGILR